MLEAAPHLSAAIEGIVWKKCDIDRSSEQPILSVIELKLTKGVNVQDDAQPGGVLWKRTLNYIQQLPSTKLIYWGLGVEDSNSLCLFIQWNSTADWKNFQESLGVLMMIGLLVEPPYNHSLRVRWPDWFSEKSKSLEIICFLFPPRFSVKKRSLFEENWCDLMRNLDIEGEVLPSGWIERQVSIDGQRRAEKYQYPVFLGFISQLNSTSTGCPSLAETVVAEFSADDDVHISQNTYYLSKDCSQPDQLRVPNINDLSAMPSTAWLINIFPYIPDSKTRESDNDLFKRRISNALEKFAKISKAGEKLARFGPYIPIMPQGSCERMGKDNIVYGGSEPLSTKKISPDTNSAVDIFWLEFDPDIVDSEDAIKALLQDIDEELKARLITYHDPNNYVFYTDVENYKRLLLTVWYHKDSWCPTMSMGVRTALHGFKPRIILMRSSTVDASLKILNRGRLEVTSFYFPKDTVNRPLFEQHYTDYSLTMMHEYGNYGYNGERGPAESSLVGWQRETMTRCGKEMACYIAITSWYGKKDIWYMNYVNSRDYELLGHKVDILRLLATGGVESQFFSRPWSREDLVMLMQGERCMYL